MWMLVVFLVVCALNIEVLSRSLVVLVKHLNRRMLDSQVTNI